jgi:hypothetical protein
MSTTFRQPDATEQGLLEEVAGYLNFSSGARDARFLRNVNALFAAIETECGPQDQPVLLLCRWLEQCLNRLTREAPAFDDVSQARAMLRLLEERLLPEYRQFHRDLLWHQSDRELWRPLFAGRAWEALLSQGPPWDEADRIVAGALKSLNDYIGYRPVAVVESGQQMEPYAHEWVAPIPLYIRDVGVAAGPYRPLLERALAILAKTDPEILQQAWFDPRQLSELALDPRAYEFDHPASKRPNHHFGQWDPHSIDLQGFYHRFVLQQITLDALLARTKVNCNSPTTACRSGSAAERMQATSRNQGEAALDHEEACFEAAAVLAGTILMASGTSGNGPDCHGSDVKLSTLLPHIAAYRDQFYEGLLAGTRGPHGEKLRAEARRTKQPFGGARQHLNHELARRRATQMQRVHLAQLYARIGYAEAALAEAHTVRIASARMLSQIYCRLTAGHQAIDARELSAAARYLPEIEDLLQRGIECGALVDPWNIIGFGGNFSLFPALENSVHDFRVDDLVELLEQILNLCARAWTEAAAVDDAAQEAVFSAALARIGNWWDHYATASVSGVKRLVGKEIEVSTNLVAGALNAWHKAGAEAGNVKFWRMFVDQFDSPKAFQLVVEALLDRGDQVAAMALMLQWVSQIDRTPLEDGDASFHPLALRWLREIRAASAVPAGEDRWPLVAKFFSRLEASAEGHWQVPTFELAPARPGRAVDDPATPSASDNPFADEAREWSDEPGTADEEESSWTEDSKGLFSAAYENMVYRDSTDDGFDAQIMDESGGGEFELEQEAQRLARRLEFLTTIARLWRQAAIAWDPGADAPRRELLAAWHQQAASRCGQLLELLESVHRYPISEPNGSHESMVEHDRRRMVKESLLEQIASTCVETVDASRSLSAAAGLDACAAAAPSGSAADRQTDAPAVRVLEDALIGDAAAIRRDWPAFARWLGRQELLYVPLARGGRPRRVVRARALGRLIQDLLGWLPRLGLVRETCQLLDLAYRMEVEHPVGSGAVTEFDRLFAVGYQALVRCLVSSADVWGGAWRSGRSASGQEAPADAGAGRGYGVWQVSARLNSPSPVSCQQTASESDAMLVEALQELTESQLHRWLSHSRTLRLNVVERLSPDEEWQSLVSFIRLYGGDLFTQRFLHLANLRSILHQGAGVWLSKLEQHPDTVETRIVRDLGTAISREDAARWLTNAIEAVAENYREYRDYNTTTTQSDSGELLYILIDFLRLRAGYDRIAWNLRPVVMSHEILVRSGRTAAAELWQQALAERTAEAADAHLARFDELCDEYGIRLASVAERLSERFTRPLAIDRLRSLVGPAIVAARAAAAGSPQAADCRQGAFEALREEIETLAQEPTGAGLDLPDWLEAVEEEVSLVRCQRRHGEPGEDVFRRIDQVRLSWEDWQRQIGEEGAQEPTC